MKKLLCFLSLLFFVSNLSSQEVFSVDVFLDPKMASKKDGHGNTPFTLNFLLNGSIQLEQGKSGYYSLGQSIEYADLAGGEYVRYSPIQIGYTINSFGFAEDIEATMTLNYGIIRRWGRSFTSYGSNFDLSYSFTDYLKLTSLLQIVQRSDIENPATKNALLKASVFVGLKLNIFKI